VIVLVDKRQGTMSIRHMSIPTRANSSKWHEQAIFKKPGIRTVDGGFWHSYETDVATYGYRFGSAEEAKLLGYTASSERQSIVPELASTDSTVCFRLSSSKLLPSSSKLLPPPSPAHTPNKSFPPPPPYQTPERTSVLEPNDEIAELRKLVSTQQATIEAMTLRLERMEALMLALSSKVFPK